MSSADPVTRPTNIRWRVFLLIAAASFAAYVLRGSISIATPAMIQDLELSEIQFGWIVSAFLWSYTICQFPGGIFGGGGTVVAKAARRAHGDLRAERGAGVGVHLGATAEVHVG